MACMVECSKPSVLFPDKAANNEAYYTLNNPIVNLDMCSSITKGWTRFRQDDLRSIKFIGTEVEWVFLNEADRTKELKRVLKLVGPK